MLMPDGLQQQTARCVSFLDRRSRLPALEQRLACIESESAHGFTRFVAGKATAGQNWPHTHFEELARIILGKPELHENSERQKQGAHESPRLK